MSPASYRAAPPRVGEDSIRAATASIKRPGRLGSMSRGAESILQERGVDYLRIPYLEQAPDRAELERVLTLLVGGRDGSLEVAVPGRRCGRAGARRRRRRSARRRAGSEERVERLL